MKEMRGSSILGGGLLAIGLLGGGETQAGTPLYPGFELPPGVRHQVQTIPRSGPRLNCGPGWTQPPGELRCVPVPPKIECPPGTY